jgi:hypothetical protein
MRHDDDGLQDAMDRDRVRQCLELAGIERAAWLIGRGMHGLDGKLSHLIA